jgi:hypothetical protein
MTRPLNSEVLDYLEKHGERASKVLSRLGQLDANLHANLETSIGREILKDDCDRLDILIEMCFNEKLEKGSTEMAELRYLRGRINQLSRRIKLFNDGLKQIHEDVNKK